jgi:hypothetical protein
MRPLSRDSWLAIGLLAVLLLVTIAAAVYQARGEEHNVPLSSFSSAPNGARALHLWLSELGYPVSNEPNSTFHLARETGLTLILEPFTGITPDEWETIDAWVEEGGTLVLAGERWGTLSAARHYDFSMAYLDEESQAITLTAQTPLLASPPLTAPANARPRAYLRADADADNGFDFVTHLAVGARPVIVSFEVGDGRVILSATPFPFSNAGLKETGNPQLVANVIAAANRPGEVWFDEWHHGVRSRQAQVVGPEEWLRRTPSGRSLLYAAAVIFVALVLGGRRFGRPIPLAKSTARRAPLEHITAIANLNRRAGHRTAVLLQHRQRLKRELGKRYRLNPTLPDDEYVSQLAQFNPNLDADALRGLLARLRQHSASESDMVQSAAQVATWLKEA